MSRARIVGAGKMSPYTVHGAGDITGDGACQRRRPTPGRHPLGGEDLPRPAQHPEPGSGGDLQVVVIANNGTTEYRTTRYTTGTWQPWDPITAPFGNATVDALDATTVEGNLQLAYITADGRILHTVRSPNNQWSPTVRLNPNAQPATPTAVTITAAVN